VKQQPEVSVLIPTHNRGYCLAKTIDSVLQQSYPNCRAYVVDDGSTDATPSLMVDRYGGNAQVVYIRQTNQGVSAARNAALAAASGDFIALLDSDDVWKPWKVELQLACLRNLPEAGMIWTDMDAVNSDGVVVKQRYLKIMYRNYRRFATESIFQNSRRLSALQDEFALPGMDPMVFWGDIFSPMVMGNLVHTSTALLRRERASRVGPFDESLRFAGEDHYYHLLTCREGPVAFVDIVSIDYCVGHVDRLSRPAHMVHVAQNFLTTVGRAVERDRARITLPDSLLRAALAEGHSWLGSELFRNGDMSASRRHLLQGLRLAPIQSWRIWVMLLASLGPAQLSRYGPAMYRNVRARASRLLGAGR
jgi:GT2 family glycosyltransferase